MYACLVEFGGHNLNGFTPNLTSQIQRSNSTGQIQPVKFNWSNLTGRIGCKSIEIDAGQFG